MDTVLVTNFTIETTPETLKIVFKEGGEEKSSVVMSREAGNLLLHQLSMKAPGVLAGLR